MSICESNACKFIKTILIVSIIGLAAFNINGFQKNLLTGSTVKGASSKASASEIVNIPSWKAITDTAFLLGPKQRFMAFGKEQGKTILIKYSISGADYVEVYWVSSEEDCRAIEDSEAFNDYSSCEPEPAETLKFKSPECNVPSDSGICIINKNDKEVRVSLVIERKQ